MKTIRVCLTIATMAGAFAFAPAAFATGDKDHQCERSCGSNDGGHGSDDGLRGGFSVSAASAHSNAQSSSHAQGGAGGSAVNANANNAQNNNNVTSTGGSANNANNNNANNSSNATGGAGGLGGSGGAGGAGGSGGTGGTATNNNTNSADNSSNATGGNATGGSSSADNNGNNNGNNNSSSSNNQSQSQSANNDSDNSNSNNSSQDVSVNSNYQRDPVSTAYAAPLVSGEDTCMGSSSMGAQAVGFGLSIGTTWQDQNCQRLKNSRQLVALGYQRAATSLMCVDDDVRHAMEEAGTPCPSGGLVAEAALAPAAYMAAPYVQEEQAAPAPVRRHQRDGVS